MLTREQYQAFSKILQSLLQVWWVGGPGERWNVNVAFISLQVRLAVPELAALADVTLTLRG
jgi:hypothetical protein